MGYEDTTIGYDTRPSAAWFLAAMNGLHEPKTITIDLPFLKTGKYSLSVVSDDKNNQANALLENNQRFQGSVITFNLSAVRGFVGRFEP